MLYLPCSDKACMDTAFMNSNKQHALYCSCIASLAHLKEYAAKYNTDIPIQLIGNLLKEIDTGLIQVSLIRT